MKFVLCFLLMLFSFINFLYCLKRFKSIREYGLKSGYIRMVQKKED